MAKPGNFGLGAMTKRSLGSVKQPELQASSQPEITLRVIDIILDENHLSWEPEGGISQLGTILGNQVSSNGTISSTVIKARPAFSGVTKIPLVNEYVKASSFISPNSSTESFVYSNIIPVSTKITWHELMHFLTCSKLVSEILVMKK